MLAKDIFNMASPTSSWPRCTLSHGPTVSGRTALRRLRDPHALRASAFLGAPPRTLAAAATCTDGGSVDQRADVGRGD
jgi:hypothetical protein